MAKSSRRRKNARPTQRQAAARKQRERARERQVANEVAQIERWMQELDNAATPAGRVAEIIIELAEGGTSGAQQARRLAASGRDADALDEIVAEMRARSPQSLATLTLAAGVARETGDTTLAARLLDEARAKADAWDDRRSLAHHMSFHDRTAEAIEAARELIREHPDGDADVLLGYSLESLVAADPQAELLADMADRTSLYELRTAIDNYLDREPEVADLVGVHVGEWQETLGLPDDAWETSPLLQMAVEHALHTGSGTGEEPYLSFAGSSGTPLKLAMTARDCAEAVYGLWQVREPVPGPGLRLTELLSGAERYVMFAPEQTTGLAPWAVLLGAIAAVDGIWRTMASMVQLSPDEGDRCADRVLEAADALLRGLEADSGRTPRPTGLLNQVGEPHGILLDHVDPVEPDLAAVLSTVTGFLLPSLVADVESLRNTPPELRNTDGHPVTLVNATITLAHHARTRERLLAHSDITLSDDGNALHWWGDKVPVDVIAQQRAALIEQGHEPLETGTPSRWLRADLAVDGPTLVVNLNSRERLSMLLDLLRSVGDSPVVVSESRVDPVADRAWPPAALPPGQSPAGSGLSPLWLDTPLPVLGGRTPRVAATGEGVIELEQLLRNWEFTGAVDTGWIRDELEMPID